MGKLPAIMLYPGDWLQDEIARCSLGAQGLMLRLMFLAHGSTRYGYLVNADGSAIPLGSIAQVCGCTPEQCQSLLDELDSVGKLNRTADGIIFIRRMVRDAQKRAQTRKRVRRFRDKQDVTHDVTPLKRACNEYENETLLAIQNSEAKETTTPPTSSKRKRKNREELISGFSESVAAVVNPLIEEWPTKRKDGSTVRIVVPEFAGRVDELLQNPAITAELLLQSGRDYLKEKPEFPHAPQYFFGPGNGKGPPWRSYARMIYHRQQQENSRERIH